MISFHVFVTGAFGALGTHVVERLSARGCRITCLAPRTPEAKAARAALRKRHAFDTAWGDLRDAEIVWRQVAKAKPDAIVHLAEVRPPLAYQDPERARAINVEGTRALIRAALALPRRPRFVFISSAHVHGPRNASEPRPLLSAGTPYAAVDTYGRHKVLCEQSIVGSGLPYTILRLGRLLSLTPAEPLSGAHLRMLFELPHAGRVHAVHPKDAALAVAGAVTIARAAGRILAIGGAADWRMRQGELLRALYPDSPLGQLPPSAFCLPHPEVDAAWFFEDWMDTEESQGLLQFQEHALAPTLAEMRAARGLGRQVAGLLAPLRRPLVARRSPYHGGEVVLQRRPTWERLCTVFDLDPQAE